MNAIFYYLSSAGVITVYGVQVCPFIERLGYVKTGTSIGIAFVLAFVVRLLLLPRLLKPVSKLHQPARQFFVEVGTFTAIGLALTLFHFLYFYFPLGSGMKLLLGCTSLGLFGGIHMALERERMNIAALSSSGERVKIDDAYFSITKKFTLIAVVTVGLVTLDLILLIRHDVDYLSTAGPAFLSEARRAVIIDVIFVGAIFLTLTTSLILSFSRNLRMFFRNETFVLEQVQQGELENYVPVTSNDEFGQIAQHTNRMIDGLREHRRIRETFGKFVDRDIASRIMRGMDGMKLGGSRADLVIVMSDVRDFTARSEAAAPETVVSDLNQYLTKMVDIIKQRGGVVDKFIGDGILAFFGLINPKGAADHAVSAAVEMMEALEPLNEVLSEPIHIGIGIHLGPVVAGVIGAPDRREYTIIGDAVNTAARLETMTKEIGHPILVSADVYRQLKGGVRNLAWEDLGEMSLRGRKEALKVFALPWVTQ